MNTPKQLTVAQRISGFFRALGLPEPMPAEKFWAKFSKKHGQDAQAFREAIRNANLCNDSTGVDRARAHTESMSLDLAGQYDSKCYRDFVEWLLSEVREEPSNVLDLGCGNGVLTCLLAHLWPNARVIGVDRNEIGLAVASAIATRVGLKNVEFRQSSFGYLRESVPDVSFDLIIAVKVFHEMLAVPDGLDTPGYSVTDLDFSELTSSNTQGLGELCSSLTQHGRLISVDRWNNPDRLIWFIRSAEASGMRVSLDTSSVLVTTVALEREQYPISVLSVGNGLSTTNCHLLSFFVYRNLEESLRKLGLMVGATAEAFYVSMGPKTVVASAVATEANGRLSVRKEVFIAGTIAGLYTVKGNGEKGLYLAPSVAIASLIHELDRAFLELDQSMNIVQGVHDIEGTLGEFGFVFE